MLGCRKRSLFVAGILSLFCLMAGAAVAETMGDPVPGLQVRLTDDVVIINNATGDVEDGTASISFQMIFGAGENPVPEGEINRICVTVFYASQNLILDEVLPANWMERFTYTSSTPGTVDFELSCSNGADTMIAIPTDSFTTFATLKFKAACQGKGNQGSATIYRTTSSMVDIKHDGQISRYSVDTACASCWDDGSVTIITPGDLNGDCKRNLADITDMIGSVYLGKFLDPMAGMAADVTCDGKCTLDDITRLIDYIYLNGTAPGCP